MADRLDSRIQEAKRDEIARSYGETIGRSGLLTITVYRTLKSLEKCLEELERTVFDLLAPITAQDQEEIQAILRHSDRSEGDVERMFSLIERRGANFVFFFKHAAETTDVSWYNPFLKKEAISPIHRVWNQSVMAECCSFLVANSLSGKNGRSCA